MHYAEIKYCDIANGQGVRTSLFVSGCRRCCPGCFNQEAQDFSYGKPFAGEVVEDVLRSLEPFYIAGLTVLGGEPMEPENQQGLLPLLQELKARYPQKTVWLYTGDVYEDLIDPEYPHHTNNTDELLSLCDILVDGPFLEQEKDITLQFRGSRNQRIIDLQKTRAEGHIVLWQDSHGYDIRRARH